MKKNIIAYLLIFSFFQTLPSLSAGALPCEEGETTNCLTTKSFADKGYVYYLNKNYAKAIETWKIGADNHEAHAQFLLAQVYEEGRIAPKNIKRALTLYEEAAGNGLILAYQKLGSVYYYGQEVKKDNRRAFEYYEKAANGAIIDAQLMLAQMYAKGEGTELNVPEAIRWYKLPASKGSTEAMIALGDLYQKLDNTNPQNLQQAALYYTLAAEKKDKSAQFKLAKLLFSANSDSATTQGLKQNKVDAYKWARLSVDLGGNSAPVELWGKIKQSMTPEEIAEADQKISKWRQQKELEKLLEEEKQDKN